MWGVLLPAGGRRSLLRQQGGGKQCALLDSSSHNCGECGNVCPKDRICKGGKCVCAYPTVECDGECVYLTDDHDNCGRCGHQCASNRVCLGGECVFQCEGKILPEGSCCSDIDCWEMSTPDQEYFCCSGPDCFTFDIWPYQCYTTFPAVD
jgi:hypothetical protein